MKIRLNLGYFPGIGSWFEIQRSLDVETEGEAEQQQENRLQKAQLLVQTGWGGAEYEYAMSKKKKRWVHASSHMPTHPSIYPCSTVSPCTEPASCVRAHLGTVHVRSRRKGFARNHSWSGQAFANRLAGIWEQKERRGKKKKQHWEEMWKRRLAMERHLRGGEEAPWGERCGIKFLNGNYPMHSLHGSSVLQSYVWLTLYKSPLYSERCRLKANIRTDGSLLLFNFTIRLLPLPYPWTQQQAALSSCFSSAPTNTHVGTNNTSTHPRKDSKLNCMWKEWCNTQNPTGLIRNISLRLSSRGLYCGFYILRYFYSNWLGTRGLRVQDPFWPLCTECGLVPKCPWARHRNTYTALCHLQIAEFEFPCLIGIK